MSLTKELQERKDTKYTILVVDDDQNNLQILSMCMKDLDCRLLFARDGESALEKVALTKPHLILMDVVMPRMDGFAACSLLKKNSTTADIPVIFMTSLTDTANKVKGFELGGIDYITKPFQLEEVIARIKIHISIQEQKKLLEEKAEEEVAINEELIALNEELRVTNDELLKEIHERQRIEEKLAKANEELTQNIEQLKTMQSYLIQAEKMAALGKLVAGLAHEINTPIGIGITSSTYLTSMTQELSQAFEEKELARDEVKDYLKDIEETSSIIYRNIEKAGKLIRNFKEVATDQSHSSLRVFNVRSYTLELLQSLKPIIKKHRQQILVKCTDTLAVEAEPGAFSQIITNLVMNALTHGYKSYEEPGIITISAEPSGAYVKLTISDDGQGMELDVVDKIYDPFFTTKRGEGGTGLGLYIVYNLISQQFKGSIKCFSEPGKGTSFEMQLLMTVIQP